MCSLCCTERYGAGRNPNQHRRPRARQAVKSIRTHTFTHTNTPPPFTLSHTCNQLHRYWLQTHERVWLHKQRCVFWWWPRIHTRLGAAEALAVSFPSERSWTTSQCWSWGAIYLSNTLCWPSAPRLTAPLSTRHEYKSSMTAGWAKQLVWMWVTDIIKRARRWLIKRNISFRKSYLWEAPAVLFLRPRASVHLRSASPSSPAQLHPHVWDVGVLEWVDVAGLWDLGAEAWVKLSVSVHGAGAVQRSGERWGGGRGVWAGERRDWRRRRGDGVPVKSMAAGQVGGRRGAREGVRRRHSCSRVIYIWSVEVAVVWRASSCGGRRGRLLGSRCVCDLLILAPRRLAVFCFAPCLFFLFPVGLGVVFPGGRCCSVSSVGSVAGLPVGTMQRQRERYPAVPELTGTDAGRPASRSEWDIKTEED